MALLLALVCVIVASIVITTGTTASGRLAGLAESDQRYYAVTSAAELLSDRIDGKTFEIHREKDYTETTTTKYSVDPLNPLTDEGVPIVAENVDKYTLKMLDPDKNPVNFGASSNPIGLVTLLAETIAFDGKSVVVSTDPSVSPRLEGGATILANLNDGDWQKELLPLTSVHSLGDMVLEVPGSYSDILRVKVKPSVRADGSLMVVLENDSSSASKTFKLNMVVDVTDESSIEPVTDSLESSNTITGPTTIETVEIRNKTDRKTDLITFTVVSITSGEVAL